MKAPKKPAMKEIKSTSIEAEITNSRLEFLELQLSMMTRAIGELHKAVKAIQETTSPRL